MQPHPVEMARNLDFSVHIDFIIQLSDVSYFIWVNH